MLMRCVAWQAGRLSSAVPRAAEGLRCWWGNLTCDAMRVSDDVFTDVTIDRGSPIRDRQYMNNYLTW